MKRQMIWVLILIGVFHAAAFTSSRQIAFDEKGRIMTVTPKEDKEFGLFDEYPGFMEANLFEDEEGLLLEVTYRKGKDVLREQKRFTGEEAEAYLGKVRGIISQSKIYTLDQTGRPIFLAGTTAYSVGYYGWAIPMIFGFNDIDYIAPGTHMLVGATGFIFPYFWSQDKNVTLPQATLSVVGGGYGLAHGLLINMMITGTNDINDHLIHSLALTGSLSELIGGYTLAGSMNMTEGETLLMYIGGGYGLAMGFGTSILSGFMDVNADYPSGNPSLQVTPPLLESFLGYGLAYAMNQQYPYSVGDVEVFWAMGEVGTQLAFTAMTYIPGNLNIEYDKLMTAMLMTGSFTGFASAHYLMLNDKNFSVDQGALIYLWKNAGNLVGLGLAYILSMPIPEQFHDKVYSTASFTGSTLMFAYFYNQYAEKARNQTMDEVNVKNFLSVRADVSPLVSYINPDILQPSAQSSPILEVAYRF